MLKSRLPFLLPQIRRFFFAFLLSLPALAQDTTGVGMITGKVLASSGQPETGVKVCIAGTQRCATSGGQGQYTILDVRAGSYRLDITPPARPTFTSQAVEVRAGLESVVDLSLPGLDTTTQSVTVTESVFVAQEEVKNSAFLVQSDEIFKSAGALQDVSRYIQTLPGVVIGSDDFRNDVIVRGGSPLENLFVVDNIEIPNINTFANFASAGGTVSILDAAMIQDTTFLSGGYPSPYINRTSSVLQITQKEGNREELHGRATVGFAGAGGILEGPIKKEKGSWIVSARRSFLDLFTDDTGIGGVPVLWTFNAKAVYDLTPRDRIWGVSITGLDSIRLGVREGGDAENENEVNNLDINYDGWRSANGFNWQRLLGEKAVGLLGVTHSEAAVNQRVKDLYFFGPPDPNKPLEDQIASAPEIFRENSREGETTFKYDLTAYLPAVNKLQAGGSFKIFRINYDTASPYGTDTPYSPVLGVNPFFLTTNYRTNQAGAYFQSTRDLTRRLNLTWGGRIDNYSYIGSTRFSPRAGLAYRITDKLSWRASYGTYYQQPFFVFLSAFPQNRGLVPFRADHYVTGLSYVISPTFRVTVEAYRKNYKDYPVSVQSPTLSLANIGDTFNVQEILFPLTSAGRGRAQGIEFFTEKKFTDKWFGQANFALSRTRHAGLDGVRRYGSFDYARVFNVVGGYRFNRKWELSTRLVYLNGRPYIPFDQKTSTAQRRGVYDLSRVNEERLPDYLRFDIRLDRTFIVKDKPLLVFVGVQNLFNRNNVAGYTWNRRFNRQDTNEQLGVFPLVGMDWRF